MLAIRAHAGSNLQRHSHAALAVGAGAGPAWYSTAIFSWLSGFWFCLFVRLCARASRFPCLVVCLGPSSAVTSRCTPCKAITPPHSCFDCHGRALPVAVSRCCYCGRVMSASIGEQGRCRAARGASAPCAGETHVSTGWPARLAYSAGWRLVVISTPPQSRRGLSKTAPSIETACEIAATNPYSIRDQFVRDSDAVDAGMALGHALLNHVAACFVRRAPGHLRVWLPSRSAALRRGSLVSPPGSPPVPTRVLAQGQARPWARP